MFKKLIISVALALTFGACSASESTKILEVTVGPKLADCTGFIPMKCMVVDGNLFYNHIEGFNYEEGYVYKLRIEKYDAWPGQEAPQDTSRYGYRLMEVISKTPGHVDP